MRLPWTARVWRSVRRIRRERDVVIAAARWLLEENAQLRHKNGHLRSRLQDALAEVARRPHPDDISPTRPELAARVRELEDELDLADAARCRCDRRPGTGPADDAREGEW